MQNATVGVDGAWLGVRPPLLEKRSNRVRSRLLLRERLDSCVMTTVGIKGVAM